MTKKLPFQTVYLVVLLCMLPRQGFAEKWLKFHSESWSHSSQKLKKKLYFRSNSYFDSDSIKRTDNGDVTVWTRDISQNDRFYVSKGIAEQEVVYKQILLRCKARKYVVMLGEGEEFEQQESASEEIKADSVYDKLFNRVCVLDK